MVTAPRSQCSRRACTSGSPSGRTSTQVETSPTYDPGSVASSTNVTLSSPRWDLAVQAVLSVHAPSTGSRSSTGRDCGVPSTASGTSVRPLQIALKADAVDQHRVRLTFSIDTLSAIVSPIASIVRSASTRADAVWLAAKPDQHATSATIAGLAAERCLKNIRSRHFLALLLRGSELVCAICGCV